MRRFQINITLPFRIQIKMVNKTRNIEVITVQFNVDCKTKFGETVFICGSCEQLGHWTPHNGLMLQTNRRNYPQWTTSRPLIMKTNQMIQFKICVIKESTIVWENLLQNRVFFIGSRPLQIYLNFNNDFIQIHQKKVVQMDCRNGLDAVMDDMQSEWGSSIGHLSNYPLQRFHMGQRGQKIGNRSNISSNLMSICDDDELQFQLKIMNYLNPVTLGKSTSRPCNQFSLVRENSLISQTNKIISLHSQTPNQSPRRRIFSSLPKKITNTDHKAPFQQKLPQKFSFFNIQHKHSEQQTNKTNTLNSESLPSYKKINSDKDTFKGSPLSKMSSSSSEGDSFQNDSVEEMFGLQMF